MKVKTLNMMAIHDIKSSIINYSWLDCWEWNNAGDSDLVNMLVVWLNSILLGSE